MFKKEMLNNLGVYVFVEIEIEYWGEVLVKDIDGEKIEVIEVENEMLSVKVIKEPYGFEVVVLYRNEEFVGFIDMNEYSVSTLNMLDLEELEVYKEWAGE